MEARLFQPGSTPTLEGLWKGPFPHQHPPPRPRCGHYGLMGLTGQSPGNAHLGVNVPVLCSVVAEEPGASR